MDEEGQRMWTRRGLVLSALVVLVVWLVFGPMRRNQVVVEVVDGSEPVAGAEVCLRASEQGPVLDAGVTDRAGRVMLVANRRELDGGEVEAEVLILDQEAATFGGRWIGPGSGWSRREVRIDRRLDLQTGALLRMHEPAPGAEVLEAVGREPGEPGEAARDGEPRARVVVELDWIEGLERPTLTAETRIGRVGLEDVLRWSGIEAEVVWSDAVPAAELGDEAWPREERLRRIVAQYRDSAVDERRRLQVLLVPHREVGVEAGWVIERPDRAAVVFVEPEAARRQAGAVLHAVGHELGHLLGLRHPWEEGADVPGLMSYPWRWSDWDWSDPRVYRLVVRPGPAA